MDRKIEILLATYNGEAYLREQLDSILHQEYDSWVVRASDDASTDNTYEILMEYQSRYPERFVVERREKGSGSAKINFFSLLKDSTGDYVMCCDQDDVWLPNKISMTMGEMQKHEAENRPVLVHTDLKVVDAGLRVLSPSFFAHSNLRKQVQYRDLLIQNHVTGCTVMMNRPLVDLMNQEQSCGKILMHDWLAALLAAAAGVVAFVDCPTVLYRQHGVNSVGAKKYGPALLVQKLRSCNIRQSLIDTTRQAGEVARTYHEELPAELCAMTEAYAGVFEKNKLQRVGYYFKYKVWKKGLSRKLFQILMG